MKTLAQKSPIKTLGFIGIIMITLLAFNPVYGQSKTETTSNQLTVKGIVSDENGPLDSVNVTQKGTNNGTTTNAKGEFTFPVKLSAGDVLVFSFLGLATEEIRIKKDTSFIKVVLTEDVVEIIGALDTAKPYKSKRKN